MVCWAIQRMESQISASPVAPNRPTWRCSSWVSSRPQGKDLPSHLMDSNRLLELVSLQGTVAGFSCEASSIVQWQILFCWSVGLLVWLEDGSPSWKAWCLLTLRGILTKQGIQGFLVNSVEHMGLSACFGHYTNPLSLGNTSRREGWFAFKRSESSEMYDACPSECWETWGYRGGAMSSDECQWTNMTTRKPAEATLLSIRPRRISRKQTSEIRASTCLPVGRTKLAALHIRGIACLAQTLLKFLTPYHPDQHTSHRCFFVNL